MEINDWHDQKIWTVNCHCPPETSASVAVKIHNATDGIENAHIVYPSRPKYLPPVKNDDSVLLQASWRAHVDRTIFFPRPPLRIDVLGLVDFRKNWLWRSPFANLSLVLKEHASISSFSVDYFPWVWWLGTFGVQPVTENPGRMG